MDPKPIINAPRDGTYILVYHTTHGWVEAHFCPGAWFNTQEGREYDGPVWVIGDSIVQEEVEETPEGFHDGPITHWMTTPGKP